MSCRLRSAGYAGRADTVSVVQRRVVVAVVANGIADLLVLRSVAVEISKEVGHHLVRILRHFGHDLLFACGGCQTNCARSKQDS